LNPSFGYFFELFYLQPHGLVYALRDCPTNTLIEPPLTPGLIKENGEFWTSIGDGTIRRLAAMIGSTTGTEAPGLFDRLLIEAHVSRDLNPVAANLGLLYSRSLNWWGVTLQRNGFLKEAAKQFQWASEVNPRNSAAIVNLQTNKKLQEGRPVLNVVSKRVEEEFETRDLSFELGINGPYDEPTICYLQGKVFVDSQLFRQAAGQFDRAKTLAPDNLSARMWLAHMYVLSQIPDRALETIQEIHDHPDTVKVGPTNQIELFSVEASAHLAKGDLAAAEKTLNRARELFPGDPTLPSLMARAYLNYGYYTNALIAIEEEISLSPTNTDALVDKSYACLQIGQWDNAIAALTQVLTLETNNYKAMLNRAIAYLRADRLDDAQRDYEALQKAWPTAFQIDYGLAEIAFRKQNTNAAVRSYELYLTHAPTNTSEAKFVIDRLKELTTASR
jgi:tetratricopeptide (TPR) repeat protein